MIKIVSAMLCMVVLFGTPSVDGRELLQKLSVKCSSQASSMATSESQKSIVEAAATASSIACGKAPAGTTIEVVAKAIATATATAIASSTAVCESKGKGAFGCASASSQARSVATAISKAWAKATAETANKECGCTTSAEAQVQAFKKVIVDASASSQSSVCTSGDAVATAESYVESFVSASIITFAKAIAAAYGKDGKCKSEVVAEAENVVKKEQTGTVETIAECEARGGSDCETNSDGEAENEIKEQNACYSVDNGLKWYKPNTNQPACKGLRASSCCRRVANGQTKGLAFRRICGACNFPLLSSSKCSSLRKCEVAGTCDC